MPRESHQLSLPEEKPLHPPLSEVLAWAARRVLWVLNGHSLSQWRWDGIPPRSRSAVAELSLGTLRQYGWGDAVLHALLQGPVSTDLRALLLVSLHRLDTWPDRPHTVVDQAVNAVTSIGQPKARGLVNAVLRNAQRRQAEWLMARQRDPVLSSCHPAWWGTRLVASHPEFATEIIAAGNGRPPLTVRVNQRTCPIAAFKAALLERGLSFAEIPGAPAALRLFPLPMLEAPPNVEELPGYAEGWFSVQDLGAQRAADLLAPEDGERMLDACAAPGGKSAHLLELANIELLALDLEPGRVARMRENLARLKLPAQVNVGDAVAPASWWDGQLFDAVLADVPCSASGVVRRHPDIKWLRQEADVAKFAATQARILNALWPLVARGGRLLYATCSVFEEENQRQSEAFQTNHPDARLIREEQWLPTREHDGFYYALFRKPAP